MSIQKRLAATLAAAALAACASPAKQVRDETSITDAQAAAPAPAPVEAAAPAPAPEPAPAAPACTLDRVLFAFDSAQLDDAARGHLKEGARCLDERQAPAALVEGHADERGTQAYNLALGWRRANAVKQYLADLGVTARLEAISFGEELPAVPGDTEAAWSQNRRAELRLPGEARADGAPAVVR